MMNKATGQEINDIIKERVTKQYHRYLIEAEKLRKGADYNLDIDISFDEANQIIQQAE